MPFRWYEVGPDHLTGPRASHAKLTWIAGREKALSAPAFAGGPVFNQRTSVGLVVHRSIVSGPARSGPCRRIAGTVCRWIAGTVGSGGPLANEARPRAVVGVVPGMAARYASVPVTGRADCGGGVRWFPGRWAVTLTSQKPDRRRLLVPGKLLVAAVTSAGRRAAGQADRYRGTPVAG
jgi:hypothetical protein